MTLMTKNLLPDIPQPTAQNKQKRILIKTLAMKINLKRTNKIFIKTLIKKLFIPKIEKSSINIKGKHIKKIRKKTAKMKIMKKITENNKTKIKIKNNNKNPVKKLVKTIIIINLSTKDSDLNTKKLLQN